MSLEHRRPVASAGRPDLGFQAAFGFYLGLVAGGLVALAGLAADVTTATLLGTFPTVVTAVTLGGHVLAKRSHGLPERIGRHRLLRLACYLPAVGFAAAAVAPSVTPIGSDARYLAVTISLATVVGVTAFGLERLCRNRFVKAVTADEPTATWTYRPAGMHFQYGTWLVLSSAFMLVGGIGSLIAGNLWFGVLWIGYGVAMVAWGMAGFNGESGGKKYFGKRFGIDTDTDAEVDWGELRVHERGIRRDQGRSRKLVPWENISGVELTDDELVLERRFRNLRCDRDAIDDPESVYEALEEMNSLAENRTADRR